MTPRTAPAAREVKRRISVIWRHSKPGSATTITTIHGRCYFDRPDGIRTPAHLTAASDLIDPDQAAIPAHVADHLRRLATALGARTSCTIDIRAAPLPRIAVHIDGHHRFTCQPKLGATRKRQPEA
ncbi:MAG: hypothetical protein ACTH0V_00505 [Microbacteriaceae bacterium]